ncbi:MAG: cytochrome P460 family protein [Burkholderiales bacterium]|nr:cytochrome P460 family protein [Burkholderiales bacterium]
MRAARFDPLYDAFGGIHHLYANRAAMEGYARGRFPDGAVIVFDLLAAERGESALTEGPRKIVGVMHKDAKRFAATGGWGFEGFRAGNSAERAVGKDAARACFACHISQRGRDYVFSNLRD